MLLVNTHSNALLALVNRVRVNKPLIELSEPQANCHVTSKYGKTLTIGGFEWSLPHWSVLGLVYIRAIDWFLVIFVREGTEVRSTDYRTMLTLVRAGISRGIKLYVFKNISNKMELSLILSTWETVFDYWLVKAGFHDSTCCIQLFIYSLCNMFLMSTR